MGMQPMRIGKLDVHRVEEMIWTISPRFLFAGITYNDLEPYRDWLVPHFCAEDLKLRLSIHTFVVRTPHHTILVDTCIGNDRKRDVPLWNNMRTDYLDRLMAASVNPAAVDYVFCTHMHVDHVGWNTRLENGRWVPTFPQAKYLFHRSEWEYWQETRDENQAEVMQDSVLPIIDAGLAMIVEADHVITDGIRLESTPGHTPGHCSVHLTSAGAEAVITGDMIHHPWQIAEPQRTSRACWNGELAVQTRVEFLRRYADTSTRILGTHFAPPTAVHVVSHGDTFRVRY
jgi:glyoxylase-like metal-dependent hydrolase (beta-lactamase superfamily II)